MNLCICNHLMCVIHRHHHHHRRRRRRRRRRQLFMNRGDLYGCNLSAIK